MHLNEVLHERVSWQPHEPYWISRSSVKGQCCMGFFVFFYVCDTAVTRGQYLALSKVWGSCFLQVCLLAIVHTVCVLAEVWWVSVDVWLSVVERHSSDNEASQTADKTHAGHGRRQDQVSILSSQSISQNTCAGWAETLTLIWCLSGRVVSCVQDCGDIFGPIWRGRYCPRKIFVSPSCSLELEIPIFWKFRGTCSNFCFLFH